VHLFVIPNWANTSYGVVVPLFALWRGGWRERAVAAPILVEYVVESSLLLNWPAPEWLDMSWDGLILLACVAGALRSTRYWTIVASSFAVLQLVTHFLQFAPGVGLWAYMSAQRVWGILLTTTLLVGAWPAGRSRQPLAATGG
jgi:hypothetical protein